MKITKLFPAVMIVIQLIAAGVYACHKDIRMTVYWTAAAILNIAVTY